MKVERNVCVWDGGGGGVEETGKNRVILSMFTIMLF